MIAAILACIVAAGVVVASRRTGWGWAAPMNLYVIVWTAAIALYGVKLFPFYDLSPATWLLVGLAACAFLASCFAGGVLGSRTGSGPLHGPDDSALTAVMRVFFLAGLAGSGLFLWRVHQSMGLQALVHSATVVHSALSQRAISSSHLFLYYFGVAATIVFAYRVLALRRKARPLDVLLLLTFVCSMAISTERTQILWCLACAMFSALLPPRGDRSLPRMLAGALIVVVVAGTFYLAVGNWLLKSPAYLSRGLQVFATARTQPILLDPPPDWQAPESIRQQIRTLLPGGRFYRFSSFYVSVAATLPALDQVVRAREGTGSTPTLLLLPERNRAMHVPERTYGSLTFRPIERALARLGILRRTHQTIYEEALTPFPHNVYTYVYEPFLDFGWMGALAFAGLFGFAAGWIYRRAARSPESVWPLLMVQVQAMVVWSAFQNRVVVSNNWYLLALVVVAHSGSRLVQRYAGHSRAAAVAGER